MQEFIIYDETLSTKNLLEVKKISRKAKRKGLCSLFAMGVVKFFLWMFGLKKHLKDCRMGRNTKTQVHKKVHEIFGCYAG